MPQVIRIRIGDARTLRLIIRTTTMQFVNLTPYAKAELSLYTDAYDPTSLVETWSTLYPDQGTFVDPVNGQVEFYLTTSQTGYSGYSGYSGYTGILPPGQYVMRARLFKDTNHVYTVYEGVLQLDA